MYSNNAITNNRNNITLGAYRDAIISIFSDENVVRAIGTINSMYEEYLTLSHKIDQRAFLREGECLSAKAREFQRTAEEAQKSLKEGIGRAASKFRGNSKEAFVARKVQSDLQKALNASNYNKQQYARRAATALENASKSKIMAANLGKFTYGATVAMGTLSMGSAWWKALDEEGNWSDVGLSSASFLGGLMGFQWGAALGVGAFGLLTGGAGWLVVGTIIGGGSGAWWGSLGAEKAWRWFEDFLNLNRSDKFHVTDPLALDLDGDSIETVATKGLAGALFDHRSQGIRTATGWIAAYDGFPVRKLNSNGGIISTTDTIFQSLHTWLDHQPNDTCH